MAEKTVMPRVAPTTLRGWFAFQTAIPIVIAGDGVVVDIAITSVEYQGMYMDQPSKGTALFQWTLVGPPAGLLNGVKCHLFTDALNPTMANVLADFLSAEAAFGGYAAQAVTWIGPKNQSPYQVQLLSAQQMLFSATAPVGPSQNIKGWFIAL